MNCCGWLRHWNIKSISSAVSLSAGFYFLILRYCSTARMHAAIEQYTIIAIPPKNWPVYEECERVWISPPPSPHRPFLDPHNVKKFHTSSPPHTDFKRGIRSTYDNNIVKGKEKHQQLLSWNDKWWDTPFVTPKEGKIRICYWAIFSKVQTNFAILWRQGQVQACLLRYVKTLLRCYSNILWKYIYVI